MVVWEPPWVPEAMAALPAPLPRAWTPSAQDRVLGLASSSLAMGVSVGRSRDRVAHTYGTRIPTGPGFLGKEVTDYCVPSSRFITSPL